MPDARQLADSGLAEGAEGYAFMAGQGCGTCRGSGFRGRRAIAEFLVLDDELREGAHHEVVIRGPRIVGSGPLFQSPFFLSINLQRMPADAG